MRLIQQLPNCTDFDVVLDGETTPAFRILLPEMVTSPELELKTLLHTIPGRWAVTEHGAQGEFCPSTDLELSVQIQCASPEIFADISIRNLSAQPLTQLRANVCANINHLPGTPPWCNRAFMPSLPLDRDAQGRYWYEKVAPGNLLALSDRGWIEMHPHPQTPDASLVPQYSFKPNVGDVCACAVASADRSLLFFQAWDGPCQYCAPFPGNACMHLLPVIANVLASGSSAVIRGIAGIFAGNRDQLTTRIRQFYKGG
jgi:hypothetical protein